MTEVAGEFVEVLHGDSYHRYLGRRLNLSINRCDIEITYRKQQAWHAFKKHEKVLMNKHVSLKDKVKFSDMCITPCILFALIAFPMTLNRIEQFNLLQRKMLRRIRGWRRIQNEDWRDTMIRMNTRMEDAYNQFQ